MKNYPITIETGEHAGETVWVHRSIAVAGFIFCKINDEWCVNQRGEGAPDFQGYWNCPCGYLDFDETLAEACSRETGVKIEPSALYMCSVNDDPKDSNRQNVTMRFMAVVDEADLCEDDDPYTIDDCPIVHYVGGFETDRAAMTNVSSEDIAFIRSKSKWDSGTAENILRRHTMKYLNPSFYGQQ